MRNVKYFGIGGLAALFVLLTAVIGAYTTSARPEAAGLQRGPVFCLEVHVVPAVVNGVQGNWVSCPTTGGTPAPPTVTATAEPTGSATLPPPPTAEPTPTISETPTSTVTPTAEPDGHDTTQWHPPALGHHHGSNPDDLHPDIVAWMDTHEYGPLFQGIGHPWESSPIENLFPITEGKHEGWTLLAENDTGCDRFNPGGNFPNDLCISAYAMWVHTVATAEAPRTQVHSWKAVLRVCEADGSEPCGIVALGGWHHFGEFHNSYKRTVCRVPGFPVYPPQYTADQPPYSSYRGGSAQFEFWNSNLNPVLSDVDFGTERPPNALLWSAWLVQAWESSSRDLSLCTDPAFDVAPCPDGSCEQNATRFQVFTIVASIDDFPRPFEGFVHRTGQINETCNAPGPDCIPLVIEASVPAGNATLNRPVMNLDPAAAPVLDFDPDDTAELWMPGYDAD